ncbi:MAG: HAD hydrolase-like protein [Clostridia bacterium]|nr:HAD hydrolase-like protein [Clostridia bacterium]
MSDIVFFDLDGTLTDPWEGITRCVQHALRHFGIEEPDRHRLTCFIGPPLRRSFMERYGLDAAQAEIAVAKYRERFDVEGWRENTVYPGVPELLAGLVRRGATLAVATSKPTLYASRILEWFGLSPYFTEVVGCEMDGTRSDKAEVIAETLARLGLGDHDKSRVCMVGDRRHDIIGAKACGVRAVGADYGYAEPGELEAAGADDVAGTVEELAGILMP